MIRSRLLQAAVGFGATAMFMADATAEPRLLKRKVESGTPSVVGIGTRWNKACASIGVPNVRIEIPPGNGFVCIRHGKVIPRHIIFGKGKQCLDTEMDGVQIIYQSRHEFSGMDSMTYTLKFPRGERTFTTRIAVTPTSRRSAGYDEMPHERQKPGPAPECAALVS